MMTPMGPLPLRNALRQDDTRRMVDTRRGRRTSCIAIACVLAVLAACGGGGKKATSTTRGGKLELPACPLAALGKAKNPVEITMWHAIFVAQNEAVLRDLTDRFNAAQHDVHVKLVQQPSLVDSLTKYRAGLQTGDLPDLVQLGETTVQSMVDSGSILAIQACVDADHYSLADYVPRAIDYYTTQGALRAMPWTVGDPILYYNKAVFRKAGLDPDEPPRTLDEIRADSEKIVESGAAKHGIALRVEGYYPEYWFAKSNRLYVDHGNGRTARATKALLDNETGLRVFRWWKEMVDSGLALNTGSVPGSFDHLLAVGSGDAAMAFEAAAGLGPITALLSGGQYSGVDLGVGPLPGLDAGGGLPVGDSALWIPNRSAPEKQAAAWQFVKFLDEPANQAELHVRAGYVPIRTSATEEQSVTGLWAQRPEFRVAYDQLVTGPRSPATAGAVIGDYEGVRVAVRDAISAMLVQGLSPQDALRRAQRDADAVISAYNSRVG